VKMIRGSGSITHSAWVSVQPETPSWLQTPPARRMPCSANRSGLEDEVVTVNLHVEQAENADELTEEAD
jgi:hypothetical protein